MDTIDHNGLKAYAFKGRDIDGSVAIYAILKSCVEEIIKRGKQNQYANLVMLVENALPTFEHAFEGIKRPCNANEDMDGDKVKRVLVLTAHHNYTWPAESRFEEYEGIIELEAPAGMVYVAIVTPNNKQKSFPEVDYWLEHWTWVQADPSNQRLPLNFSDRYERQLQ